MTFFKNGCLWAAGVAVMTLVLPMSLAKEVSLFQTFSNVKMASAGVGGLRNAGSGTIQLSGVSGTVKSAWLYWHGYIGAGGETPTGTVLLNETLVNETLVTGWSLGLSAPNCWDGFPASQAFRADVTDAVRATGNGTYLISNFKPMDTAVNGASLIVFFDDLTGSNNRDYIVFDGNDSNVRNTYSNDADGWNATFPSINYTTGNSVSLQLHVSDGQPYEEMDLLFNGAILAQGPAIFSGDSVFPFAFNTRPAPFYSGLWDIRTFDLAFFLVPGANPVLLNTGHFDDCFSLVVGILDLPVGAAVPPLPSDNHPPTVKCMDPVTVPSGKPTTVTASVQDPDGNPLVVIWTVNGQLVHIDDIPAGVAVTSTKVSLVYSFAEGNNVINVTVSDLSALPDTCATTVTVKDRIPPTIVSCGPDALVTAPSGQALVPNLRSQVVATDDSTSVLSIIQTPLPGTPVNPGTWTITFVAQDRSGNQSAPCSINLIVTDGSDNQQLDVRNDTAVTTVNDPVTINVLANDDYPDRDELTIIFRIENSKGGIFDESDKENGNITYTPGADSVGEVTCYYTISNGQSVSPEATVTIWVTPPPQSPTGSFTTFTQGGWGSKPSGNNPGTLLDNKFATVYPSWGVTIGGGSSGGYTLQFTSASAVRSFLPQGGTAAPLAESATTGKNNVLAGQVLALELNVTFSNWGITGSGLGDLEVASGKLAGYPVSEVLALANKVLGGNLAALPPGVSISDLNSVVTKINENYDGGQADKGFLVP